MTELDVQLQHSLDRLVRRATDTPLDWEDVRRRARGGRTRVSLLAGAAVVCLVVGVAAGFGVGPGLWHLVAGTPVSPSRLSPEEQRLFASMSSGKPVLRTEPNSPALKRLNGKVSIRLLATRGGRSFYVIDVHGPRVRQCFAIGRASRPELFLGFSCSFGHDFPSRQRPIEDYSAYSSGRGGDVHIARLEGFAADAVAEVGLLDEDGKLVAPVPVVDNTYLRMRGFPAGRLEAIVAYDRAGKQVFCEDIARPFAGEANYAQPCGPAGITPTPRRTGPMMTPSSPSKALGKPLQHGASRGVRVDVYRRGTAIFDLQAIDPEGLRLLTGPGRLSVSCLRARFYQGRWLADENGFHADFEPHLRWDGGRPLSGDPFPHQVPPPYDGCEVSGSYGHRWNDAFGTRAVVEIPLTAEGRHFFNDRATARDLAFFVRSGRVQRIRLSADPRPGLEAFVHRFPKRVLELSSAAATAPEHTIGFRIGDRAITFTATSSTGRRFFVVAKRGTLKLPEKNLGDLAFVF
jgi:hypothetical protein